MNNGIIYWNKKWVSPEIRDSCGQKVLQVNIPVKFHVKTYENLSDFQRLIGPVLADLVNKFYKERKIDKVVNSNSLFFYLSDQSGQMYINCFVFTGINSQVYNAWWDFMRNKSFNE